MEEDLYYLTQVLEAAKNLIAQKGRHNTLIAYKRLEQLIKLPKETNAI